MSEPDDSYYIVKEYEWLECIQGTVARIKTDSSFIENHESNKLISTYENKTCVYEVNSYEQIYNDEAIIPYLYTKDNTEDIILPSTCVISHPDFIKTTITSKSLMIENDYISEGISNTNICDFDKVFGIKNNISYIPFTSNYVLRYDMLTVDKDIEFCNLGKLEVSSIIIGENKKLTVSNGTITVNGNFTMEDGSTIQCKKLSF